MFSLSSLLVPECRCCCSFSCFPCVGVRLVHWSLRCTATFIIRFHWSLLGVFSLHFSSSSAFLRYLFTQSYHLRCGLPRFMQPSCFFVSDLFGKLSSFILTMCPAHFIRLLTLLPTMQASDSLAFFWAWYVLETCLKRDPKGRTQINHNADSTNHI